MNSGAGLRFAATLALLGVAVAVQSAGTSDDGVARARQHAEEAAADLAALIDGCQRDLGDAIDFAAPQTPSDADDDAPDDTRIQGLGKKLSAKADEIRSLAKAIGLKSFALSPKELAAVRKDYRPRVRDRDLRRAEAEIEYALRRRHLDEVSLDPTAKKLLSTAKSFLSDFRQARVPVADLADQDPSREWERRLGDIDADVADIRRETRLLEIQLALSKLQELNMDPSWR